MDEIVLACAVGTLLGIILFFILAFAGYIDKWSDNIDKWRSSR